MFLTCGIHVCYCSKQNELCAALLKRLAERGLFYDVCQRADAFKILNKIIICNIQAVLFRQYF